MVRLLPFFLVVLILAPGCGTRRGGSSAAPANSASGGGSEAEAPAASSTDARSANYPLTAGKYTILGILTDNKDHTRAKGNAEDTLANHPDIACMVGLWAYNPPAILSAVKGAGKEGQVKIVAFDEQDDTLAGIAEGHIHGTIVQQPFLFGYRSVEYLAAMARGQEVEIPESGKIFVPHTVIQQDNVAEFRQRVTAMLAGNGEPPQHDREYDTSQRVEVAFITNSVDPFWTLAQKGCELAEPALNAKCHVLMPPNGQVEEQKRYIEEMIATKCQGLAISPIDPANQIDIINQACELMPVICQDSDAPDTNRKFYLGTSNYLAGRAAGKLVKEACPDGGKVMILVGKMEVLNAQERSQGVIDELLDAPIPDEFADQTEG
jgi:ribose transport system substrate-binding protein